MKCRRYAAQTEAWYARFVISYFDSTHESAQIRESAQIHDSVQIHESVQIYKNISYLNTFIENAYGWTVNCWSIVYVIVPMKLT